MSTKDLSSLEVLYKNFQIVNSSPHKILSEQLTAIDGKLSTSPHNKILNITLALLNRVSADTVPNKAILAQLRDAVYDYGEKATKASKVAERGGGKPYLVSAELIDKIVERLGILHAQVGERLSPPEAIASDTLEVPQIQTQSYDEKIKAILQSTATEWFLFRGLDLCSRTLDTALQIRESLKKQGYRFYFSDWKKGVAILPPIECLETPLPICLLALHSQHIFNTSAPQSTAYQNQIVRLLKAQKRFPQHEKTIANMLLMIRFREIHESALQMLGECETSLTSLQHIIPDHCLGKPISMCLETIAEVEKNSAKVVVMKTILLTTDHPSDELKMEIGEKIEQTMILLEQIMSGTFRATVSLYKEILSKIRTTFRNCYSTLPSATSKTKDVGLLPFTPIIQSQMFTQKSVFSSHRMIHLPSCEEISAFTPMTYTAYADTIMNRFVDGELMPLPSSTSFSSEFLPKNLLVKPRPQEAFAKDPQKKQRAKKRVIARTDEPAPPCIAISSPSSSASTLSPQKRPSTSCTPDSVPPTPSFPSSPTSICPIEKALQSLSLQDPTPSIAWNFKIGDGPDPRLQYAMHVRRWRNPDYDPFKVDPEYREELFSPQAQEMIRMKHTPPLALVRIVLEYGEKYVLPQANLERFFLPAEAIWYDGSDRFVRGGITIGRNSLNGLIFHYTLVKIPPSQLRQNHIRDNFIYCPDESEYPSYEVEEIDQRKTLPSDGSVIQRIEDYTFGLFGVTVDDSLRKFRVEVFI